MVETIVVVSDAYRQEQDANEAVDLATWIERKRDALEHMRQEEFHSGSRQVQPINSRIEQLLRDPSEEAEAERQYWEGSMLNAQFPVTVTSQEIEFQLYDEWCYKQGAYFVTSMYETGRHYPGYSEVGRTDQSHPAFRGEQVTAPGVPVQILDRFRRLGLRPERALHLPQEWVNHEQTAPARGSQHAQYGESDTSRYMPYEDERAEQWTGPERFRRR